MKAVDLTLFLKKDNPIFGRIKRSSGTIWDMGHMGTHLDIMDTCEIPLDYRSSKGKVYDVSNVSDRDICIEDLNGDAPQEKDFILFNTGFMEKYSYDQKEYFFKKHLEQEI